MNWFLKAKHWQIFVLILVAPVVIEVIGFVAAAFTREPGILFVCIFFVMAIALGTQFGWIYSVGSALGEKLSNGNSGMNVRRFRTFALIPAIYIGTFVLCMVVFGIFIMGHGRPSPFLALLFLIIIPMHLFSMFCIFYSIWFIAKSLKMVERWNHVELGDYIGDFFLIWFLLVGIWFVQPRINRLFDPTLPPQNPNQYNSHYYNQYPPQYPPQNPNQYPPQNYNQYPPQYPPPPNY